MSRGVSELFSNRVARVCAVACVAFTLTACTSPTSEDPVRLIPQGLQETLESLRDPWGLFVDPSFYSQPGGIYSTAMIDDALGGGLIADIDIKAVAPAVCDGSERKLVGALWYSWAAARVLGNAGPSCLDTEMPALSGDLPTDIPQTYAWVDAEKKRGRSASQALAHVESFRNSADRSNSPYVMWRLDQLEDALGLAESRANRVVSPPDGLESPAQLVEWWGYVNRCATDQRTCVDVKAPANDKVAQLAVGAGDDLSLTAAISILRINGANDFLKVLRDTVDSRRVENTGLLRTASFIGDVQTTYQVLRLDWQMFPGPAPDLTSAQLERRLEAIPQEDVVKRMQALAVLKAVDPKRWARYNGEVESARSSLDAAAITKDKVRRVGDLSTALGQMGEVPPKPRLDIFTIDTDEDKYLAKIALGHAAFFLNEDEVINSYSELGAQALEEARKPTEPVAQYIASLGAVLGSRIQLTPEESKKIETAADGALRGCFMGEKWAPDVYRTGIARSSACSIKVLVEVSAAGFGVYP